MEKLEAEQDSSADAEETIEQLVGLWSCLPDWCTEMAVSQGRSKTVCVMMSVCCVQAKK